MAERRLTREEKKVLYRKLIVEAAKKEFVRKGYKEASIAAIMDEAKLGVGTFYNYFASKEEILMCLLAQLLREVMEDLARRKKDGEPAGCSCPSAAGTSPKAIHVARQRLIRRRPRRMRKRAARRRSRICF